MSPDERRKADAALADLAFNLASDLSSGHFGMPDAVQMIEGLATRLAALSRRAVPMEAVAWREAIYVAIRDAPDTDADTLTDRVVQALAVIPTGAEA